jgi:Xaa-Pro aminopeptidase
MTADRVEALRRLMEKHQVDAYIVPGTDPHQSEYLPKLWLRRPFISGFTGSAGDVIITRDAAGLWTDSRYFIQAETQLDPKVFTLFKLGVPGTPTGKDWLATTLDEGAKVGIDTRLFPREIYMKLGARLARKKIELKSIDENLVDAVWPDQPSRPEDPVKPHDVKYAGESVERKLERLRDRLKEEAAGAHVVTMLDAVAWLFNIRGTDVAFNPVAIAYAIVTDDDATLYVDEVKIGEEVRNHLDGLVEIKPYDDFEKGLKALKTKVWLDPASCSQYVVEWLDTEKVFLESPITLMKAVKNATEIEGFRTAHVRDGAALVRFFMWLEKAVPAGGVTELTCMAKLEEFRSAGELHQGPSFDSIVGYQGNGAIVHYTSTEATNVVIRPEGILLVDSGGQYLDGTTDVTRTLALGAPTEEQRDRFTRVLKGHIKLAMQPFPEGSDGVQLDTLARMFLWEVGLNFGHGIGHGVGSYLNVHERPPAISYLSGHGHKMQAGMVCSNEPGYYKEGEYGFRQENMVVTKEIPELSKDGAVFLTMEDLTMVPIDLELVEKSLMTAEEVNWLNEYHRTVREKVTPLLDLDEAQWLGEATRSI